MAHHLSGREAHRQLVERLNRFPQGAPPSETLFKILSLLFSEREAALVAQLPIRHFTAADAARRWGVSEAHARETLEGLASRALLVDSQLDGVTRYVLPPPMAGFFEFSLMRVRDDLDQQLLAELFYQYLNVEEDFIRSLFATGTTRLGRALVHEPALAPEQLLEVLDWDRASAIVESASAMAVSLCYCRHKMAHLDQACAAPLDICMTFGTVAESLSRHGHARRVDVVEGLDLLHRARELGLVQFAENVRREVSFICNCCGCCCEAMIAARRHGLLHPVHTTAFEPVLDGDRCRGCGRCVSACPVEALSLVSAHDPARPARKRASLDPRVVSGAGCACRPAARAPSGSSGGRSGS